MVPWVFVVPMVPQVPLVPLRSIHGSPNIQGTLSSEFSWLMAMGRRSRIRVLYARMDLQAHTHALRLGYAYAHAHGQPPGRLSKRAHVRAPRAFRRVRVQVRLRKEENGGLSVV